MNKLFLEWTLQLNRRKMFEKRKPVNSLSSMHLIASVKNVLRYWMLNFAFVIFQCMVLQALFIFFTVERDVFKSRGITDEHTWSRTQRNRKKGINRFVYWRWKCVISWCHVINNDLGLIEMVEPYFFFTFIRLWKLKTHNWNCWSRMQLVEFPKLFKFLTSWLWTSGAYEIFLPWAVYVLNHHGRFSPSGRGCLKCTGDIAM